MICRRCPRDLDAPCDAYYHLKSMAGLFGPRVVGSEANLTTDELFLIGALPRWERPRSSRSTDAVERDRGRHTVVRGVRYSVDVGLGDRLELTV